MTEPREEAAMERAGTPSSPVFVTTIYGHAYAPFLAPHLRSLATIQPGARGVVLWQDLPEREIALLAAAFPRWTFTKTDADVSGSLHQRIPRKLHAWRAACAAFPDDPIAFVDCDTLLVRPLDAFVNPPGWDVIYTWKDEPFPINTGVILARDGRTAATLLDEWVRKVERIVRDPASLAAAVGSSGAADQHALREMIGWVHYDRDATRSVAGRELVFRGVPCRRLNETNCRPMTDDLHIIHYKTGWHPILLQGASFTRNRPEERCREMFAHWRASDAAARTAVAREAVTASARAAEERFSPLADGYQERGILNSEMLAVCGTCDRLGVDVILESGRCRGQSTLVLARYFLNRSVRIVSVELDRNEEGGVNSVFAEARLAPFKSVELLYGDGTRIIPELLRTMPDARVAVLLDGPKGMPAVGFLDNLFAEHANVAAAFLHDTRRGTPQRAELERADRPGGARRAFFTDDAEYVRAFAPLDRTCLPKAASGITIHTWRPGMKGHDAILSYGPTLACLFPIPASEVRTHQEQPA
ncbi:MAG: hypothetical protein ACKVU4_06675 [Phycisphaerales bacterium]